MAQLNTMTKNGNRLPWTEKHFICAGMQLILSKKRKAMPYVLILFQNTINI